MNVIEFVIALLIVAAGVSALLTGVIRRYAIARRMLDVPNKRSSHSTPVPRGGGLSIVMVFTTISIWLTFAGMLPDRVAVGILGGGMAIAAIGYLDDRWTVSARLRFLVHAAAALWAVFWIGGLSQGGVTEWQLQGVVAADACTVLAIVWSTNLFNFMDGIDGIAATEAMFVGLSGGVLCLAAGVDVGVSIAMLLIAATAAGFLAWNWPPARIFMGDVGSGFLGFGLAGLGLSASRRGTISIDVWAILGGVFLVDATVTLLRRAARGDRWFEAHRLHAYQHASRRWQSHRRITVGVAAIDVLWLLPWAWFAMRRPDDGPVCMLGALTPLVVLALVLGAGRPEETDVR